MCRRKRHGSSNVRPLSGSQNTTALACTLDTASSSHRERRARAGTSVSDPTAVLVYQRRGRRTVDRDNGAALSPRICRLREGLPVEKALLVCRYCCSMADSRRQLWAVEDRCCAGGAPRRAPPGAIYPYCTGIRVDRADAIHVWFHWVDWASWSPVVTLWVTGRHALGHRASRFVTGGPKSRIRPFRCRSMITTPSSSNCSRASRARFRFIL